MPRTPHERLVEYRGYAEDAATDGALVELPGGDLLSLLDAVERVLTPDQRVALGSPEAAPRQRVTAARLQALRRVWALNQMGLDVDGRMVLHVAVPISDLMSLTAEVNDHRTGRGS